MDVTRRAAAVIAAVAADSSWAIVIADLSWSLIVADERVALPHNLRIMHVVRRQVHKVRAWPVPPIFGHELGDLSLPLYVAPRHLPAVALPHNLRIVHVVWR